SLRPSQRHHARPVAVPAVRRRPPRARRFLPKGRNVSPSTAFLRRSPPAARAGVLTKSRVRFVAAPASRGVATRRWPPPPEGVRRGGIGRSSPGLRGGWIDGSRRL